MLYTCKECGKIHKRCELEQCVFRVKHRPKNKLVAYQCPDCGNDSFRLLNISS